MLQSSPSSSNIGRKGASRDTAQYKPAVERLKSPLTSAVTNIFFPTPIDSAKGFNFDHHHSMHPRPSSTRPLTTPPRVPIPEHSFYSTQLSHSSEDASDDSIEPTTPVDYRSIDQLWGNIRQQKELKMAKEPSKIKSFEASPDDIPSLPASPPPKPKPSLRRRKSIVTYRESGSDLVAVLDMQGFSKEDIHVSYQRDRLVVTWELVEVLDVEEGGHLVRERRQKVHTRHIDLPPGTKFDRVRAAMGSRHLVLRYPNPNYHQEPSMTVDEY